MNERIWQLQGQTKVLAEEIFNQRKYDDYIEYKQSLMDQTMNKFAELIVQECVELCSKQFVGVVGTYPGAHNNAVKLCVDSIREQFGVEE